MGLLAPGVFAQVILPVTPGEADRPQGSETQSRQFFSSEGLVGATVQGAQGETLGKISALLINSKRGQTFAAFRIKNNRQVLVPVEALQITRSGEAGHPVRITLNKTKAELEAAPSVGRNEWANLDNPSFTQRIYRHFNVQAPAAAVGGSGEAGMGGQATGSGSPKDTNRIVPPPTR
jgi:hypothetical protein